MTPTKLHPESNLSWNSSHPNLLNSAAAKDIGKCIDSRLYVESRLKDPGTFFASILQGAFVAVCNSSASLGRMNWPKSLTKEPVVSRVSWKNRKTRQTTVQCGLLASIQRTLSNGCFESCDGNSILFSVCLSIRCLADVRFPDLPGKECVSYLVKKLYH